MTPTVVLVHGLARTHRSLGRLRDALEQAGFPTWARTYPSRRLRISESADFLADKIDAELPGRPLAAVTHSLGGIVVRHLARRVRFERVVMLAPPNQGSRAAAALRARPLFRWFYGPAGQELAEPETWPPAPAPCAVIAGTRGHSPVHPGRWLRRVAPELPWDEANDGTVGVDETRCAGVTDFAAVDASHTWIMDEPIVHALVVRYLTRGSLERASAEDS